MNRVKTDAEKRVEEIAEAFREALMNHAVWLAQKSRSDVLLVEHVDQAKRCWTR